MIRAPWWTWLAAFGAGLATTMLWPSGSPAAVEELEAAIEEAADRAQVWRERYEAEVAFNDTLSSEYRSEISSAGLRIADLESRVQASQESAADIAESIRLRVDEETVALVDDLEANHAEAIQAKDSIIAEERTLRLAAEAGWRDARLAIDSANQTMLAMDRQIEAQQMLVRILTDELSRRNHRQVVATLAGIGGVLWGLTR